jgi:putative tryptophan/tyrosine transport system substrate-binding protein
MAAHGPRAAAGRKNSHDRYSGDRALAAIDTFDELIRQLGKSLVASLGVAVLEAKVLALDMPEIIESPSDVILTWGTDAVLAAKQATTTIPIVMGTVGDPLGSGIVTNLAHPDANVTRIVLPRCRA